MLLLATQCDAHDGAVWCCRSHPLLPGVVVTTGADKAVKFWLVSEGVFRLLHQLQNVPHHRTIRSADWSDDGKYLALASFDGTTSVFRTEFNPETATTIPSCSLVSVLEGHESEVKCASWSHFPPNQLKLATCSRDKSIWIWACDDEFDTEFECIAIKQEHTQDIKCVRWHPHAPLLFSASYDCSIRVWAEEHDSEDDWECIQCIADAHQTTVWSLAFDPTGYFMVSAADDGTCRLWGCKDAFRTWHCIQTLDVCGPEAGLFSVAWSPSAGLVAFGSGDNHVFIAELISEQPPCYLQLQTPPDDTPVNATPQQHTTDVNAVCWATAGVERQAVVVSGAEDGSLKLWRPSAAQKALY